MNDDMKTKVARGIARSIRDMVEASASIINIDASEDRYLNHVMEARCRHAETLDRTEQAIVNLLVCRDQVVGSLGLRTCGDEMNGYEMEFPDYDDILPELEGFVDSSWNRDACPSLSKVVGKGGRRLTVFVDYKDLSFRENDEVALEFRYTVVLVSFWQGEEDAKTLLRTNDWSEVVKLTGEIK